MTEAQTRPDSPEATNGLPMITAGVGPAPEAPPAATPPQVENPLPEDRYLNRELSWLDFNARVLALAADPSLPLLERLKFLAIFASNLDEFYMVRVAGLKRRDEMGLSVRSADGLSPREQLRRISERTRQIAGRHSRVFLESVRPALADEGIVIVTWAELEDAERAELSTYFHEQVFPVLTPLAVDPAHPFPFVSGLSLNLAITVKHPDDGGQHFARIKVPDNVDRFVELSDRSADPGIVRFLPMEELIAAFLPVLFPGLEIVEHHAFRITRNADFEVEEERDEDLL
ncbi:MAG: RNA degradosome polyphosphate kinase, partial [Mycobacterium sp.]|nr:RNA degradosome polyphosphate kinase [Mycobacterium sp.]